MNESFLIKEIKHRASHVKLTKKCSVKKNIFNLQEWFMRLNIGKSPRPPASPNIIVFVFNKPGFLSSNIIVFVFNSPTHLSLNIICHQTNGVDYPQTSESIDVEFIIYGRVKSARWLHPIRL